MISKGKNKEIFEELIKKLEETTNNRIPYSDSDIDNPNSELTEFSLNNKKFIFKDSAMTPVNKEYCYFFSIYICNNIIENGKEIDVKELLFGLMNETEYFENFKYKNLNLDILITDIHDRIIKASIL